MKASSALRVQPRPFHEADVKSASNALRPQRRHTRTALIAVRAPWQSLPPLAIISYAMTKPDDSRSDKGSGAADLAMGMLSAATKAVPAMRYAVGVGGVGAVVSLVLVGLKLGPASAIIGGLVVLVFMTVLLVFSKLSESKRELRRLSMFLAWSFTTLAVAVTVLFISCFFFDTPKSLPCLLKYQCRLSTTTGKPSALTASDRDVAIIDASPELRPTLSEDAGPSQTDTGSHKPSPPTPPRRLACDKARAELAQLKSQFPTPCSARYYALPNDMADCKTAKDKIAALENQVSTCQ